MTRAAWVEFARLMWLALEDWALMYKPNKEEQ